MPMLPERVLITGKGGQLATALAELLPKATVLGIEEMNLTRIDHIPEILEEHHPQVIINAAAYTAVDKAEEEEPLATIVNAEAPAVVAAFCKAKDIPFLHYSTDYVFSGEGENEWNEEDEPEPINAYGRGKLRGEELVLATHAKALIFRTSWVYDAHGKNFVNTMLRMGKEREELSVVHDQIGRPTYAPHLAAASLEALENALQSLHFPTGIYHLSGGGEAVSWHDFATAIFDGYDGELKVKNVKRILTHDYPTPAPRPHNSRLDCSKAKEILGVEMPDWREGLQECLKELA